MGDIGEPIVDRTPDFGHELKRARELRGISLKEIADSTKISKRFLEAIERNDMKALPAPVFTRGFVREYARYLGLNSEEIVTRYGESLRAHELETEQREAAQVNAWNAAAVARTTGPIRVEKQPSGVPFVPIVSAIGVLALLVAAVFYFRADRSRETTDNQAIETTQSAAAVAEPAQATATTATQEPAEGLLLQLRVIEDSWLSLEVDGNTVVNDELKAGDERTFEAKESVTFKTVGNAAGLDITLNGVKVPPLGDTGEVVRNRKFDRAAVDSLAQTRTE